MKLDGKVVPRERVSQTEQDQMFALMDGHYAGVQRHRFDADLAEKQWVIQVSDPCAGVLCGFSTQMLLEVKMSGQPAKALYSGDTIIDRQYWGQYALAQMWGRLAIALIAAFPDQDFYWFLISGGYKTYRFLPVFFNEFYPRVDVMTPRWATALIDAFGRQKYPQEYDRSAGVIRNGVCNYRLREGVADITPGRLRDSNVRYFAERNPGWARGDELCCLAPLTRTNFTPAAYRMIGTGWSIAELSDELGILAEHGVDAQVLA